MKFKYYDLGDGIMYIPNILYRYSMIYRNRICAECYFGRAEYSPINCQALSWSEIDSSKYKNFINNIQCMIYVIDREKDEDSDKCLVITGTLKFSLFLTSLIRYRNGNNVQ